MDHPFKKKKTLAVKPVFRWANL